MYCDNAATTNLTKEVKDYIISILDDYGNPSSEYSIGNKTKNIINESRKNVADFINANEDEIIFTSSGSSANTLAIKGLTEELSNYFMYCSPTAHKSMLLTCKSCMYNHFLKVDQNGNIDLLELEEQLVKLYYTTPVICLEVANSEIGTIQNIKLICKIVHKYKGIVIADFTGYIPSFRVNVKDIDVDIATFSGHKLHALKGVGVLYKKDSIILQPLVYGSQEYGLFGGTENVVGIASLGKAVETYDYDSITSDGRDYLYLQLITKIPDCRLIGNIKNRLPHNLFMCFEDINGNDLVALLDIDGIQISTGSACNNGNKIPSTTLTAIRLNDGDIHSCIRITLSGCETIQDLNWLCDRIVKNVKFLRER